MFNRKGCSLTVEHEAKRGSPRNRKSNGAGNLAEAAKRRLAIYFVVDEFGSYTYKQLQDDSAAYGAALSEYDVANRGVVIMVEKCYDTLAIMLGTLFASGYYVPVDPSVPPVRLAHIVATLEAFLRWTVGAWGLQLEDACKIVSLEELHSQRAGIQQRDAVEPASLSIDPAYVLFTSGSTGVPKGVVVSHGAIISFIDECVSVRIRPQRSVRKPSAIRLRRVRQRYFRKLGGGSDARHRAAPLVHAAESLG